MYMPSAFREDRVEVQHELMRAHPLGLLIIHGPDGLDANPLPFMLYPDESRLGVLRAHFSRANPLTRQLPQAAQCLVVFQGPHQYITPSWYATKRETGKVVPTWNYATVHAWGAPRLMDDAAWLRRHLDDMTRSREAGRTPPWEIADAPPGYIDAQLRAIIGLEISITRTQGKWKASQNRPQADREAVVAGLLAEGPPDNPMIAMVAERANIAPPPRQPADRQPDAKAADPGRKAPGRD